jgi:hypothetical protein
VGAARSYYFVHAQFRDRYDDLEWSRIEVAARHHLERARDAGDVDSFLTIALLEMGRLNGDLYAGDLRNALAHLYAGARLQEREMVHRDAAGTYSIGDRSRDFDAARLRRSLEHIAELEAVIPEQVEAARTVARILLERCCI